MPFFSSLSYGGMARARGIGGVRRKLQADFRLYTSWNGAEYSYGQTFDTTSEFWMEARGDSGAQALVSVRLWGDNGRAQGQVVMTVGQRYTFLRENNDHDWSSLIAGGNYQGNSTSSFGPQIVMLAASRAQSVCYTGGNAGFPQGAQGSGNGQSPGSQFGWGGNGGGGSGGQTTGYLNGSGGIGGAFYSGPGGTPDNGGFLQGGYGGRPWFQGSGSEGGLGYYGGGGGGGGWAPGRGSGCPGGGGGGSNYVGGLPSGSPQGFIQVLSQSSGTGGNQGRFFLDGIDPI